MIVDIPSANDLKDFALDLLNMAWDTALGVFRMLERSKLEDWDDDGSVRQAYHESRQPELRHAYVLIHQAQELGLKAAIANVSPYLLIVGEPRLWPSQHKRRDIPFEEFRTIDAADLVRIHDMVSPDRLPADFVQMFEEGRRSRNKIVHLGGHGVVADGRELLMSVLKTSAALFPERPWATYRYEAELNSGYAVTGAEDIEMGLLNDFALLQRVLEPRHIRCYFNYDRRRPSYVCLSCSAEERDWTDPSRFAQLVEGRSDQLFCAVCATPGLCSGRAAGRDDAAATFYGLTTTRRERVCGALSGAIRDREPRCGRGEKDRSLRTD